MDGPSPENYAKAYIPMDDGSFVSIDRPETKDGTIQASAGGVRSCVKDLLSFYDEILQARRREEASASEGYPGAIKNASLLTAGHTFLSRSSLYERSAALGLLRVQLPNTFGDIGPNSGLVTPIPTIGRDDPSRLVLFHQGSYPEGGKDPQQDVKSVNAYTGDYFNALQNFYIRDFDQDDALYMCFHGQAWDVYPLQPYAADPFTWYTSREDQAKRGRWPIQAGDYFKLTFTSDADGKITQLQVNMDGLAAAERTFHKKPPGSGKDEEAASRQKCSS
ncbi:predicted protein [Aspergillus terreus NIH2624]|uniref:Uncharacterized protein n=1 Tax=Aspergillus terreus (strain NIH 2624 / FGSC A1156) TaxID=341663 RepID=Q0D1T7_ASPTN|nr:uncharacterized protein ATEG_00097 [Aspergillus terreus NIH2624]EAU38743.1 predicted protein [Aspergillus terreus NIH2624]